MTKLKHEILEKELKTVMKEIKGLRKENEDLIKKNQNLHGEYTILKMIMV